MAKKYGFDGTNYRARKQADTGSDDDAVTLAFKESTRRAAQSAWKRKLPVPTIIDGVLVNVMPDGSTVPIKTKS
jgi:hypothetical protein